jgi:hypothetical protein
MDNSQNDSMFVSHIILTPISLVFETFKKKRAKRWFPSETEAGTGRPDALVDEDSGGGDRGVEAESALHRDLAGAVAGGERQPQGQGE